MGASRLRQYLFAADIGLGVSCTLIAIILLLLVSIGCGKLIVPLFPLAMLADMMLYAGVGAFFAASMLNKSSIVRWISQLSAVILPAIYLLSIPHWHVGFMWVFVARC